MGRDPHLSRGPARAGLLSGISESSGTAHGNDPCRIWRYSPWSGPATAEEPDGTWPVLIGTVSIDARHEDIGMPFGVDRLSIAAVVGDCHLIDNLERDLWPVATKDAVVFADDDLRLACATCTCGRLYLRVWRRVPRSAFEYLIPIQPSELLETRRNLAIAPRNVTDRWMAAESAVVGLASTRPVIEYSSSPPAILRWIPPGVPIAFTAPPF